MNFVMNFILLVQKKAINNWEINNNKVDNKILSRSTSTTKDQTKIVFKKQTFT